MNNLVKKVNDTVINTMKGLLAKIWPTDLGAGLLRLTFFLVTAMLCAVGIGVTIGVAMEQWPLRVIVGAVSIAILGGWYLFLVYVRDNPLD